MMTRIVVAQLREVPYRTARKDLEDIEVEADVETKRGAGLDFGGDIGTAGPGLIWGVLLPPKE